MAPVAKRSVYQLITCMLLAICSYALEVQNKISVCSFTFLVSYCGVVMSFSGESAHGLLGVGSVEDMRSGDRVMKRPMRIGMARRIGRFSSLRRS